MMGNMVNNKMKTLSILTPCFNEEENIERFYNEISKLKQQIEGIELDILFIDDGSTDNTYNKLVELSNHDPSVRYISFSRNFGKEAALFSGLRAVKGDCTVVIDVDLQHPPETIIEMYRLWLSGFDIVEGIKISRGTESVSHKVMSAIFYGTISRVMGLDMRNSSDFKLLDKKVVAELAALKERDTFLEHYLIG